MNEPNLNPYDNPFWSIILNIIGGILTAILFEVSLWLFKKIKAWRFKALFGVTDDKFELIYGKLHLPNGADRFSYTKPLIDFIFSANAVISSSDTESIKYLSEAFARAGLKGPEIVPDDKAVVAGEVFSYCAIAGRNNYKSTSILDANMFYKHVMNISRYNDPNHLFETGNPKGCDYALIVKLKNEFYPDNSMMCVAGLGELGTAGGAWFLANKWKEIHKKVGNKEFACIIRISEQVHNSKLIEYSFKKKGKVIYKNLLAEDGKVKGNSQNIKALQEPKDLLSDKPGSIQLPTPVELDSKKDNK